MKIKRKDNDEIYVVGGGLKSEKGSFLEASLQNNNIKIIQIIYIFLLLLLLLSKFFFE